MKTIKPWKRDIMTLVVLVPLSIDQWRWKFSWWLPCLPALFVSWWSFTWLRYQHDLLCISRWPYPSWTTKRMHSSPFLKIWNIMHLIRHIELLNLPYASLVSAFHKQYLGQCQSFEVMTNWHLDSVAFGRSTAPCWAQQAAIQLLMTLLLSLHCGLFLLSSSFSLSSSLWTYSSESNKLSISLRVLGINNFLVELAASSFHRQHQQHFSPLHSHGSW